MDAVHAIEEGTHRLADDELLEVARQHGRVMVTQDIRLRVMAGDWQRQGRRQIVTSSTNQDSGVPKA